MSDKDLIRELRRMAVETGSLVCFGCGHEHSCSVHGCAIINKAAARLQVLTERPNGPLTLDELREICGDPVWIERRDGGADGWAIIGDANSLYGFYFVTARGGLRLSYTEYGKIWLAYRRKPGSTQA